MPHCEEQEWHQPPQTEQILEATAYNYHALFCRSHLNTGRNYRASSVQRQ